MPILRFPNQIPKKSPGCQYLRGWQGRNLFPSVCSLWHTTFHSTNWPFSVVITEITFHHIVKLETLQQLLQVLWVSPLSKRRGDSDLSCAESLIGSHPSWHALLPAVDWPGADLYPPVTANRNIVFSESLFSYSDRTLIGWSLVIYGFLLKSNWVLSERNDVVLMLIARQHGWPVWKGQLLTLSVF